jgi:hypothetical protein
MKGDYLPMSYNSKRNIVSMAAGTVTVAAYAAYICAGNAPVPEDMAAWAIIMLAFIGIGVAAQIFIQILFHVVYSIRVAIKENDADGEKTKKILDASMKEDERDKLIGLKTSHVGYICAGAGLMIALLALAGGAPFVAAMHIIAGSSAAGSFAEGCASIYFHERGVRIG